MVADAEDDGGDEPGREQTYGAERSCFLFRIGSAMLISHGWGRGWFLVRSGVELLVCGLFSVGVPNIKLFVVA